MINAQKEVADRFTEALARSDGHRWTHITEARRDVLRRHYAVAVQAVMRTSGEIVESAFQGEPFLKHPSDLAEYLQGTSGLQVPESSEGDTLGAWLYNRFSRHKDTTPWEKLHEDDQAYWGSHANAVRRAVARGGFKQKATR